MLPTGLHVLCLSSVSCVAADLLAHVAGMLQTTFVFKGFDEVRRLGLRQETEAVVRVAKACSHGAPGGHWGVRLRQQELH